jgi:hypothetical protein
MDRLGTYQVKPFPMTRLLGSDWVALGKRKNHVSALLELDVTRGRQVIRDYRRRTGRGLSFLAWLTRCIAQAVSEHPEVNAYRHGARRLVRFDDVDLTVVVERAFGGVKTPVPYVLRRATAKTPAELHAEIAAAQREPVGAAYRVLGEAENPWYARAYLLPGFLRRLILGLMLRNAFYLKRTMGTVLITSPGMQGRLSGWAVPVSLHTLCFALGSVTRKPRLVAGEIRERECLHLTALIDHDVVDGAPAARFLARLADLIESGWLPPAKPAQNGGDGGDLLPKDLKLQNVVGRFRVESDRGYAGTP